MTERARTQHSARETGGMSVEYAGVILLVGAIIAGLLVTPIGARLSGNLQRTVCEIFQIDDCGDREDEASEDTANEPRWRPPPPNQELPLSGPDDYYRALCRDLDMNCELWDTSDGLSCNDDQVVKAFEYYGDVFREHPELQWAGMAKLAGGSIYAGMQDLHVLRSLTGHERERWLDSKFPELPSFLRNALLEAAGSELDYFENKLVSMNKQVFRQVGWQLEAYARGGIAEMRRLDRENQLPRGLIDAWEDIASGDPERIERGNEDLLWYEQNQVIGDDYNEMKDHHGLVGVAVTYMMSLISESPVPGGDPFRDVVRETVRTPGEICGPLGWPCQEIPIRVGRDIAIGNVADFDSRWQWVAEELLPQFRHLLEDDRRDLNREIAEPLEDRAEDYRLFPIPYNANDRVC